MALVTVIGEISNGTIRGTDGAAVDTSNRSSTLQWLYDWSGVFFDRLLLAARGFFPVAGALFFLDA
jgi:hypothetical protein